MASEHHPEEHTHTDPPLTAVEPDEVDDPDTEAEEIEDAGIKFLVAVVVLVVVATTYHIVPKNRGRDWKSHFLYLVVFGLSFFFLTPTAAADYIFSGLTVTIIGALLPIYESVRAVVTPEDDDDKEWLQYWMVGGVFFILSAWVDDVLSEEGTIYWDECLFFLFFWLYYPRTEGACLINDYITQPYIAPRVRPLANKMTNLIVALYETMINASHLLIVWVVFVFLPDGFKRMVAVGVGTIYPLFCSITAASTVQIDDDTYWLTYWSCYGCLFILMDVLENWFGWIPGFYTLVIFVNIYLMLPMFQGSEKIFRKILVPLAGLQEMLMLSDAIKIKKAMLRDLDPERAKKVRKAIAKFYDDDDDTADPASLKHELMTGYKGLRLTSRKKADAASGETTSLV